ncbi:MAG: DNA-directed RNA polymerase subunit alpha [Candidatus Marinamargulisbacteria bacterium]|jgi:DNA-directed RNA polymerase subunit alpha|nr:DNA-directed RNA polymerase subunit alpha [bacterium]MDG2264573.1 DNA-directed RNA polymerase subunit alpha [Candidatus Marinamargulisbacteria bacterium]|tara:strand:+ start:10333 stop:11289 length:957 start_codon:yes stop_codon:yes gene_type:complete
MRDIEAWVQQEVIDENYSKFSFSPLIKGMGTSIGNAMRRVLLSSIPGMRITSVKIDGVLHEFSTIEHIREDVLDILCNLKSLVFALNGDTVYDDHKYVVELAFKGKGKVCADSFKVPSNIRLLNPDQFLFEAAETVSIAMTCEVNSGVGYLPSALAVKDEAVSPDVIYLDASFSPVVRVNHEVLNIRVGKDLGYEKLVLDVWTNGGMSPEFVVKEGAKILCDQISLFAKMDEKPPVNESLVNADEIANDAASALETMNIDDLGLNVRALNCLKRGGVSTVRQLLDMGNSDLSRIKNLGEKSIVEINEKLKEFDVKIPG